jgi:hypothetical protein
MAFHSTHCEIVRPLQHSQPVFVTRNLLQNGYESPYVKIAVKPDIRQHFNYLKLSSLISRLQKQPDGKIIPFSPVNVDFFTVKSTGQPITSKIMLT